VLGVGMVLGVGVVLFRHADMNFDFSVVQDLEFAFACTDKLNAERVFVDNFSQPVVAN